MKTKTTCSFLILLSFIFSLTAMGQGANFSGEWKLNKEKTVLADQQLFLSKIRIDLKSDSLRTIRVYENGNGEEFPFKESVSLDGKECKITIYEMPRTARATKSEADNSIIIETTTTYNSDNGPANFTSKETWKVDNEGKTLTIGFINKMSGAESTGTNYYNKIK
jgi:hypothetical protein